MCDARMVPCAYCPVLRQGLPQRDATSAHGKRNHKPAKLKPNCSTCKALLYDKHNMYAQDEAKLRELHKQIELGAASDATNSPGADVGETAPPAPSPQPTPAPSPAAADLLRELLQSPPPAATVLLQPPPPAVAVLHQPPPPAAAEPGVFSRFFTPVDGETHYCAAPTHKTAVAVPVDLPAVEEMEKKATMALKENEHLVWRQIEATRHASRLREELALVAAAHENLDRALLKLGAAPDAAPDAAPEAAPASPSYSPQSSP